MPSGQSEIVRALSVRQPYAELILRGQKRFEYRSRTTHVRERVYLYASLTEADDPPAWRKAGTRPGGLVTGRIVGSVVISGSRECDECDEEGRFAWSLSDPKRIDTPLEVINQPQPGIWRPKFRKRKVEARPFTPPAEPFATIGRGTRARASGKRPITGELVCYHNADTMECSIWEITRPATAISAREYAGAVGKRVWFVTGLERPRRYFLAGWMRVGSVEPVGTRQNPVDVYYRSSEDHVVTRRRDLIEIGTKPWFPRFQRSCANFAGLQHLPDRALIAELERVWGNR